MNIKGSKKKNQVLSVNIFEQQEIIAKAAAIMLKGTVAIEVGKENVQYPRCIFVDVFPFDNIPESRLRQLYQKWTTYFCIRMIQQKREVQENMIQQKRKWRILFVNACLMDSPRIF